MTDSIPALIAEADDYAQRGWGDISEFAARVSKTLKRRAKRAGALESLSAPSGDEREALDAAIADGFRGEKWGVLSQVRAAIGDAVLAEGFRRLSPVTREALEPLAELPTLIENALNSANRRDGDTDWALYRQAMRDPEVMRALYAVLMSRFSLPEPVEVEWEYGVEDNIAEGGIDEGYSSEERALSMAAYRTSRYVTPGTRAWAVKRRPAGDWVPVKGTEQ